MRENGEVMPDFEMLVALQVTDAERYAQYRREMTPLLEAAGGSFRYDFEVSRTLRSESGSAALNRVFVIQFPSEEAKDRFFADPQYREIRTRHFEPAVAQVELAASYMRG
jgi:uncharacterized protein (DUF1330 family)